MPEVPLDNQAKSDLDACTKIIEGNTHRIQQLIKNRQIKKELRGSF